MAHCLLVPPMLPSGRPGLADLLPAALAAVRGEENRLGLPRRDGVVVLLVDGLGADVLAERAGHARSLTGGGRVPRIDTGCPTTTAAALATLTTGTPPGRHGLVGYSALDPGTDRVVNQLHGFDEGLPAGWQRMPTVFERAAAEGVRALAVGPRHHAGTGFTREVLRGAEYVGVRTIADRLDTAVEAARQGPAIVYCYVPELDAIAHREGWRSDGWTVALETLDAAVGDAVADLARGTSLLVTGDHGMVDVEPGDHVVADEVPGLLDGVRHLAGEPRMLHLHLEPDRPAEDAAGRWRDAMGRLAEVATRSEAIATGWFGEVDDAVLPRIGDVLVAARGRTAVYATGDARGRGMVGQHGAWTQAERAVPLLRFGA